MSGLKRSRILCLLLCLSLFLASSLVSVNAASGNLVDQDLSNWTSIADSVTVYSPNNEIYRISCTAPSYDIIYDLPSFVAGHSYTLKFTLPDGNDIGNAWGIDYTDEKVINYYNDATVEVGYGFLTSDGSTLADGQVIYSFTADNIANYLGKTLTTSFVGASSSGRPCLFITIVCLEGSSTHLFFFQDFILIDNDDNSGELTGIKGFLHSIRWDLIGGTCDDEDCPHSNDGSPHLSLTERMSAGFSAMFNDIASKFEEGSTLNTWFTNLSDGVSTLSTDMDGFIDKLGKLLSGDITGGFGDVGTWFSDLGSDLSGWFDDVKVKFQEVGDNINAKFQEIADNFTEFFEKFKPRVHIDFEWIRGYIDIDTGEIFYRDNNYPYVIVSDAFEVSKSSKFKLDFIPYSSSYFLIHQYDLQGNYIGVIKKTYNAFTEYVLPSGYIYRFRYSVAAGTEDLSFLNDYIVVYADEGWVNAMVLKGQMVIKGLFVPDEAFINNWKTELTDCMSEHLGFIYTAADFIGDFFGDIQDLLSGAGEGIPKFTLPAVNFDLHGINYNLWEEKSIQLDFLSEGIWATLYGLYKVILYIIIIFALLNYAMIVYGRIMHQ